jgi:hypothetical protein
MRRKKQKIEFLMPTDWMFEKPIDKEHKEYKLLSYFQKMGEKLDRLELYPSFIELSLHLMNVQTLIRERKIIYTDKKFNTIDDELLIRDLKVKNLPELTDEEQQEFIKILSNSAPRMMEYFNIAKSVWSLVYEALEIKVKKNKKNIFTKKGFFYYTEPKTKNKYVWEFEVKKAAKSSPEFKTIVNLIYSEPLNGLTMNQIISKFSTWTEEEVKVSSVFEMISQGEFPIEETLLPLFKRRLIAYINLSKTKIENQVVQTKVD